MASWIGTGGSNPGDVKTNGKIGAGATPSYPLDAAGRSRIRGSGAGGGGLWLSKTSTPTSNTTFMGRGTDSENFTGIYTDGAWRLVVKNTGKVGIGTTSPAAKLEVDGGDIKVKDWGKGIILTSPSGNITKRIYLTNSGTIGIQNP